MGCSRLRLGVRLCSRYISAVATIGNRGNAFFRCRVSRLSEGAGHLDLQYGVSTFDHSERDRLGAAPAANLDAVMTCLKLDCADIHAQEKPGTRENWDQTHSVP